MAYISEIKARNDPSNASDYVEVVIGPTEDVSDFQITIYNVNGTVQTTLNVSDFPVSSVTANGSSVYRLSTFVSEGSRPGSNAGVALVNNGAAEQFFAVGNATLTATEGPADGLSATGVGLSVAGDSHFFSSNGTYQGTDSSTPGVICFTPGASVVCADGPRAVEKLRPGDQVLTRDSGMQKVLWVGARHLKANDLYQRGSLAPILIPQNSLSPGVPEKDMMVSPQHRFLLTGRAPDLLFGEPEMLLPAKFLTGHAAIGPVTPAKGVTYVHVLFETHQLIRVDGTWTESFQPASATLEGMDAECRTELLDVFPELVTANGATDQFGQAVRSSTRAFEAKLVLQHLEIGARLG